MEKIREISVFFPAYNEEENISNTVVKAEEVLKQYAENYEIIVVNDGSTDKTKEVVESLTSSNDRIRLVSHDKNYGYGMAVRTGFKSCNYEWVVFTDSDGQFDFSELPNFISTQRNTNADLVVGFYKDRKVSKVRKLNSFVWQTIVRMLFGLKVKSIDCGFKLFRKSYIDSMELESERGAFISTEFLVKAKEKGAKIVEIPATHYEREAGEATGADFNVILNSFKDLYRLKRSFLLFCFIGLTSALTSIAMFNLLFWLGLSFTPSLLIGILVSAAYNFFMNRNYTFQAKEIPIRSQVWKYSIVYFIAQGMNLLVASLAASAFGAGTILASGFSRANLAVIIGIAISIPFSFLGSLLWAFQKKGQAMKIFNLIEKNRKLYKG